MVFNSQVIRLLIVGVLVVLTRVELHSQPANDECGNAIDISDGAWYAGDNTGAVHNCGTDMRKDDCYSGTTGCSSPDDMTNPTDMCCGIEGIESSIWYKFSLSSSDSVYVDFRNVSCSPSQSFGVTTTIQGFVLRRLNSGPCFNPCKDTVKACFNPSTTDDATLVGFEAEGNQDYYIEIDTKRNVLFPTCSGCIGSDPDCHSNCTFELRIRTSSSETPLHPKMFFYEDNQVLVLPEKRHLDYVFFRIEKKWNGKSERIEGKMADYINESGDFVLVDDKIKEPGRYEYSFYKSNDDINYYLVSREYLDVNYRQKNLIEVFYNPKERNLYWNTKEGSTLRKVLLTDLSGKVISVEKVLNSQETSFSAPVNVTKGIYIFTALFKHGVDRTKIFVY